MKKFYSLIASLACFMLLGNMYAQDIKTAEIQKAENAPVIDGDPSEWANVLSSYHEIKTITTGDDTKTLSDTYGFWQAVWNDTALFVYVNVMDDDMMLLPEAHDILEIYVSMDNLKNDGGWGEDPAENGPKWGPGTQYQLEWLDTTSFHANGAGEGTDSLVKWAAVPVTDSLGYNFEVAFPWNSLQEGWEAEIGKVISWDIDIADIDEGDDVKTDQYWNNWEKGLWKSLANSGDLKLIAGPAGIIGETAINETGNKNLDIYPNPVYSNLTIQNAKGIESVTVYNLIGQKIMELAPGANKVSLDMSSCANGIYLVHVNNGVSTTIQKVVKR